MCANGYRNLNIVLSSICFFHLTVNHLRPVLFAFSNWRQNKTYIKSSSGTVSTYPPPVDFVHIPTLMGPFT